MTVSVVDEALRALDRVRQQLAQERAVKAQLLAALKGLVSLLDSSHSNDGPLCDNEHYDRAIDAIDSAEGRRP